MHPVNTNIEVWKKGSKSKEIRDSEHIPFVEHRGVKFVVQCKNFTKDKSIIIQGGDELNDYMNMKTSMHIIHERYCHQRDTWNDNEKNENKSGNMKHSFWKGVASKINLEFGTTYLPKRICNRKNIGIVKVVQHTKYYVKLEIYCNLNKGRKKSQTIKDQAMWMIIICKYTSCCRLSSFRS
uniref:Uncharacterized protein n=1 Tax=Rhizophagus irregularis (strain DAOM 181602 / DAOM 197198 / MUCL 43194) TaxID=747089 RepID=U9TAI1_RHIID